MKNIKKIIAYSVYIIISPFLKKKRKKIWIFGAAVGKKYTDNGAILYKYVRKNLPNISAYWIINKDSEEVYKAKKGGPFLYRNSIKGNLYTLLADVLICTHSLPRDVSEYKIDKYKNKTKVFISHGIEGFKKKSPEHIKIHTTFDISVAVSDFEKSLKVKEWGLDEEKVCVTGLPRYDNLWKEKKENRKKFIKIFYMPTWRPKYKETFEKPYDKITDEEKKLFKETSYYKNIAHFLQSSDLLSCLEKNNIEMQLFFHQTMNPFMEKIINENINNKKMVALPYNTDIQKIIIDSDLLITDYSSVCWDFLFLDKPVVFFQFDKEDHLKTTGSYLRLPEDLFGPFAETTDRAVYFIKKIIEEGDDFIEKRAIARKRFFKYQDDFNCKRMVDCILKK